MYVICNLCRMKVTVSENDTNSKIVGYFFRLCVHMLTKPIYQLQNKIKIRLKKVLKNRSVIKLHDFK